MLFSPSAVLAQPISLFTSIWAWLSRITARFAARAFRNSHSVCYLDTNWLLRVRSLVTRTGGNHRRQLALELGLERDASGCSPRYHRICHTRFHLVAKRVSIRAVLGGVGCTSACGGNRAVSRLGRSRSGVRRFRGVLRSYLFLP